MKILVTGASGFVGSFLTRELHSRKHEILGVDSFTDYYSTELKTARWNSIVGGQVNLVKIDLADLEATDTIVRKFQPNTIIHLAAQAGIRLPITENARYTQSNLTGFSNLLNISAKFEVPNFLYASSSSVYGNGSAIPYREGEKNLAPTSFYGATKLSNEILASTIAQASQTRTRGMRFFTVYGPWGRPDMAYFRLIASAITGKEFVFYGDGSIERDFTFISDIVESICALIDELTLRPIHFSDIVNIGGGRPASINTVLEEVESITRRKINRSHQSRDTKDVQKTMADTTYLKSLTGQSPRVRIHEGLTETIEWADKVVSKADLMNWIASSP